MTRNLTYLSLVLIGLNLMACATPSEQTSDAQKEQLPAQIEKFNQAFQSVDIETLESMITDNYTHTNSSSKSIGKSSWLNYLKSRKQDIADGKLIVNSYLMSEDEIQYFDDVAILTAKITVSSTRDSVTTENEYRVTNVWVFENDQWKRAGFHDGKIR